MPLNEYDELLSEQAPISTNPYDKLLGEIAQGSTATLRKSMEQASKTPPDAKAKAQQIADRLRMPVEMVERNPELFTTKDTVEAVDYDDLIAKSPKLAEWLSKPNNAALSRDDIPQMQGFDRAIRIGTNLLRAVPAGVYRGVTAGPWGLIQAGAEASGLTGVADYAARVGQASQETTAQIRGPQTGAGYVERAVYGGVESVGQSAIGLAASIATGSPVPALALMGAQTGGEAYAQARAAGVQPGAAGTFAAGQGAIEIATEMIPASLFLRDLARNAGLIKTALTQVVAEVPGEQAATLLQDLNEWAILTPDAPFSQYLAERPSAAAQTLISTLVAAGTQTSVAVGTQRLIEGLGQTAEASKTLERDPKAVESFMTEALADSPVATVYAPVGPFIEYWQSKGLDPAGMAATLTGNPRALAESVATGADLPIPLARYTAIVAGTEHNKFFAQELKLSPELMNARETAEFQQAQAEAQGLKPDTTETTSPVAAALLPQLEAAGFTPKVAEAYTALYESAFSTLATRAGMTPDALLQQYPLTVQREGVMEESAPSFAQGERGNIQFGPHGVRINLFKDADPSTFLHEGAHLFLEMMRGLEGQGESLKADLDILRQQYGVTEIGTEQHERFAREFEVYLREGRAPSPELRPVFAKFAVWLRDLYRSIRGLGVELTPEVRGIFDRLLASDEAIAAAEAEGRVAPLFTDAASAGVSEEEFAKYQGQVKAASDQARDQLQRQFMREVQREQADDYQAKREQVRQEVLAQVHQEPVYRASFAIRKGTNPDGTPIVGDEPTPMKLDKRTLVQQYGEKYLKTLPKPYLYTVQEGVHPDTVAELYGFSSGDAMLTAIRTAPPMEQAIETETARRMKAQYPDIMDDPAQVAEEAQAAVFGEGRAKVIAAELKALTQGMARGVVPQASVLKQMAEQTIARTKVRNLRPGLYLMAAQRASKKAFDAFAANDRQTAIQAKQQELLALAQFRAARDAKEYAESSFDYFRKFQTPSIRQRVGKSGESFLDQIDALLDRYEIARASNKVLDRRTSLRKWVAAQEAQGLPVDLPEAVLDDARRVNWREMTIDELTAVREAVQQIDHLSRLKTRLLRASEKRDLDDLAADLDVSIRTHKTARPRSIETRLPTEAAARTVDGFFAAHRKIASLAREMDGFEDGGPLWEAIIRPLNEAGAREAEMNAAATAKLSEIVREAFPGRKVQRLYDKEFIPAINASLSKMGRLMVALNWGNDGNRQRIRDGYHWSDQQVQAVLDTLDGTDAKFVQDVLDFINSYWSEIAAKQQRVVGVKPEKVEAVPFTIGSVQMKGGYFPLKYDDRQSAQAAAHVDLETAGLQQKAAYVKATTRRGHTEARAATVTLPVRLDFGVMFEHVQQVIHDLSHHETLIDVGRVLGHKTVQTAVYDTYGDIVYKQFKEAVKDIAFGDVPATSAFERAMNHLRQGATIAGLGWNMTTALLQPLGLTQSMVRIGPKWVAKGVGRWIRDAVTLENTAHWIDDRSTFMRLRAQTQQREINEIRNAVGVNTGRLSGWVDEVLSKSTLGTVHQQAVADSFFFLIQQMQRVADVPTWLGAYEKARAGNHDEATSIAMADQAVLDAQGGGQIKDLSQMQRGSPLLKLWTNFYSFFNTTYNLTVEQTRNTSFRNPAQIARLGVDYLLLYSLPASLGFLLREAMRGDEDDDDTILSRMVRDNAAYLMGTVMGLRELSGAVQGFQGYEGPAGARVFASASRLVRQTEQGELDAAWWRAFNDTAGAIFHFPAGQVRRTTEGLTAILDGRTYNPFALITGPPQ